MTFRMGCGKPAHTPQVIGEPVRYVIEGKQFACAKAARAYAISLGYDAPPLHRFIDRLCTGVSTWAALCAPVNPNLSTARKAVAKKKRDEMAAVIAALDARKAAVQ